MMMARTATLRLACLALLAPLAAAADEAPAAAPAAASAATEATPAAEASTAAAESDKPRKVKKLATNNCRKVTGSMLRPQGKNCDSVNGAASQSSESLEAARGNQNQRQQRTDLSP
jgi:predicted outer membrane protein